MMNPMQTAGDADPSLLHDVRQLIEQARAHVASTANSTLTHLYWRIGDRVRREVLADARASYGEQIVATLSAQLLTVYGKGFAEKNLRRMVQFAEVFPDGDIVVSLIRQLSWTHFIALIPLKQSLEREFYAQMCRVERWSVRTLRERIGSQLYLRSAIAKKPDAVIAQELSHLREGGQVTPDLVFRDPYMLDFLGLPDGYSERDLEAAILRDMERFLLELGAGFTFVARQKRIQIDNDDFYIDLLFYNRRLKRLVAIDLKLGDFKAADKGQMELYLRWLAKHEQESGEAPPLGIILCSGKKQEQIELLELDASGIHVAEYLTELPSKAVLQKKLHEAIAHSRERLGSGTADASGDAS
jgi:predicted nuclease of restriction endonuclease-like (RecB) superfamily